MTNRAVLPGKTTGQKTDNKRRRSLRPKYRTIGVKLFYANDGDLIQWWEKAPDGEKSDVLRESIREYLARLKRDPKPASNEDVDRAMAYTGEAAQWTVNELTRQIVALSQQVTDLTTRLASGVIVQGLATLHRRQIRHR